MGKVNKSFRLDERKVAFIRRIMDNNKFKSEAQALDFALDLVDRYFDDEILSLEAQMYEPEDYRKSRK
jgi:hypothetical protein